MLFPIQNGWHFQLFPEWEAKNLNMNKGWMKSSVNIEYKLNEIFSEYWAQSYNIYVFKCFLK